VPIAGLQPVSKADKITVSSVRVTDNAANLVINSPSSGTAHVFAYQGPTGYTPVYQTSCSMQDDPAPDYGLTPCATTDGGIPAWSPDMSGHELNDQSVAVQPGSQHVSLSLTAGQADQLRRDGRLLVSYQTDAGAVQALEVSTKP
jgi:hypothetical protein